MQNEYKDEKKNIVHFSFEIGLLIKGIDGFFEIVGGILMIFLSPERLSRLTWLLTHHELSEDPKDKIAIALRSISRSFSIGDQYFGVIYLLVHGIIKCLIIALLWRRKLWAYPVSIISFVLFIVYQIYRYTIDHSIWLLLLSVFDLAMIVLTYLEYKQMKEVFAKNVK